MRGRSLIFIAVAVALFGGFIAWSHYRKIDPAAAEAAVQQQPAAQQPVAQQADSKPKVAVKVAAVTEAIMPIRRRTIGWVEPMATVAVKSRIDSVILEQPAAEGAFVSPGDVLFILDDREARAAIARDEAAMAQHQAQVERARADLERTKTLVARQTASKQTLDQAISDARVAEAAVAADKAVLQADKLTLSYTTITAPIAGRLGSVAVTPGNLVEANGDTALVTITQMQPIRVTFTLPDRDIDALRTALAEYPPAVVRVYPRGSDVARAKGQLSFIDSTVDSTSGTITAKAEFENENLALWPGQYFDTEIEMGLLPRGPIVPTVALQVGQDGLFVFVVTPEDIVEVRKVAVAGNDGGMSAIAAGLSVGERVVVDGQHQVGPGTPVTPVTD
jgi:membrane fusion protein, multidrug efflux system